MDHVFHPDVIKILRKRCAELSLMELREYSAITLEAITDLFFFSESDMEVGTPAHSALPGAFLDILYGGSAQRKGTFLFLETVICGNYCVGFDAPIDFKEGAVSNWLATSQSVAEEVLELFSHQFYVDDFGIINNEADSIRAAHECTLQETVLSQINVRFVAMTPMELHYGSYICVAGWNADHLQTIPVCTQSTP